MAKQGIHGRLGSPPEFSQASTASETRFQSMPLRSWWFVPDEMRWWLTISIVVAVVSADCSSCTASSCGDIFDIRWNATQRATCHQTQQEWDLSKCSEHTIPHCQHSCFSCSSFLDSTCGANQFACDLVNTETSLLFICYPSSSYLDGIQDCPISGNDELYQNCDDGNTFPFLYIDFLRDFES